MSCAVIVPIVSDTKPAEVIRTSATFAAQTYEPRMMILTFVPDTGKVVRGMNKVAEAIEAFYKKDTRQRVFCARARVHDLDLRPLADGVSADFFTVWKPGEMFHRDTLGHLSLNLSMGVSGVVVSKEDKRTFAISRDSWALLQRPFISASQALEVALDSDLWRGIPMVQDYTPRPGIEGF